MQCGSNRHWRMGQSLHRVWFPGFCSWRRRTRLADLWDSGSNAVDELNLLMQVRTAALRRFGENNIRVDAPLSTIEDALVPMYMLHRYQVEAASKLIAGMDYTFTLRGDGQHPTQIVPAA